MKKVLAILLAIAMIMSLSACADKKGDADGKGASSNGYASYEERDENGALVLQPLAKEKYEIKSETVRDENLELTVKKLEITDSAVITFAIKNISENSEIEYTVFEDNVSINGFTVAAYGTKGVLKAGESIEDQVAIYGKNLQESDIQYILNGTLRVSYPIDGNSYSYTGITAAFKTNCNKTNKRYLGGEVVYNENGLKVTAQIVAFQNDYAIMPIRFILENNSQEKLTFIIKELFINENDFIKLLDTEHEIYLQPGEAQYYIPPRVKSALVPGVDIEIDAIESITIKYDVKSSEAVNYGEITLKTDIKIL